MDVDAYLKGVVKAFVKIIGAIDITPCGSNNKRVYNRILCWLDDLMDLLRRVLVQEKSFINF